LKRDQTPFTNGTRSIFTEAFIRQIARRWAEDVSEIDSESQRLYGQNYFSLRYEDLLAHPFDEMQKLWAFLGVSTDAALENDIKSEMGQNLDEEWQARRAGDIASFLPKGKAGNWRNMFTTHDREVFRQVAGEVLVKWGYEQSTDW
jgi:hypothetical protein